LGPLPRSFAADAHDCIMVTIRTDQPDTRLSRNFRARWRAPPRIVSNLVSFFLGFAEGRAEGTKAEARKDGFHLVHDPRLLGDKILPLAVRPPRVLLFDGRDRYHAAMALLAVSFGMQKGPLMGSF
jgi:hypothetical protein